MAGKPKSETVKAGNVALTVYPWTNSAGREYWRFIWHDEHGARRYTTRATKAAAKRAAHDRAVSIANRLPDLKKLDPETRKRLARLLDADPRLACVDDYLRWRAREVPQTPLADAFDQFMVLKKADRGRSIANIRSLRVYLKHLVAEHGERPMSSLSVAELESFMRANPDHGNRTRKNIRGALVTFWRWAARAGHIPEGVTAAERTSVPIVTRKIPETWEPAELATMLGAVRPDYLPWLVAAAFGGFRAEELNPVAGGDKSPLDWSDIQWDRGIIIVRPETDKNGHRRIVPILPVIHDWLSQIRQESGPLGTPKHPPQKKGKGGGREAMAETKRLGELVGGWRRNALRHSWISYRAAEVGIGQAAMEAGNSENEARRSYNDAKSAADAAEWFGLTRARVAELTRNSPRKSA